MTTPAKGQRQVDKTKAQPTRPSYPAYLRSWAIELSAQANRVRHLIGDAHWLSDGYQKEHILKRFLTQYLPVSVKATRGFVCQPSDEVPCSPEIDILIADHEFSPPIFFDGELQITTPSNVLAHIEVKTRLGKSTLRKAIASQATTQSVLQSWTKIEQVWRAVMFSDPGRPKSGERLAEMLCAGIADFFQTAGAAEVQAGTSWQSQLNAFLPTCVCCWDAFIALIQVGGDREASKLRLFLTGELSLACALADLISFVRARKRLVPPWSDLSEIIANSISVAPIIREFRLRK